MYLSLDEEKNQNTQVTAVKTNTRVFKTRRTINIIVVELLALAYSQINSVANRCNAWTSIAMSLWIIFSHHENIYVDNIGIKGLLCKFINFAFGMFSLELWKTIVSSYEVKVQYVTRFSIKICKAF